MQFLDQWFPLVVSIREGIFDARELAALCEGFGGCLERGEPFALLSVASVTAGPMDPVTRLRLAEWLNEPRVRCATQEHCVGSATVVARDWERHALTALQWLWVPVVAHEGVRRVSEGIDFCVDRLLERKIALPRSPELFRADVYRGLALAQLAGLDDIQLYGSSPPPRRPLRRRRSGATPGRFETLADRYGCVVLGWVVPGVLWAKLAGYLNETLCVAYAARLSELLRPASEVRLFVDASEIESWDWASRNVTLCALVENAGHLSRVVASDWADEVNPASRDTMAAFGCTVRVLPDLTEFAAELRQAAPDAHEILASSRLALEHASSEN